MAVVDYLELKDGKMVMDSSSLNVVNVDRRGLTTGGCDGFCQALEHPLIDVSDAARDMLIASVLKGRGPDRGPGSQGGH